MANQVAARLEGDDYQHLLGWYHVLELLMPKKEAAVVSIEDERAGSADDVTIRHAVDSKLANRFFQIKYHRDQRDSYSTLKFIESKHNESSLLEKLFKTWALLKSEHGDRSVEIHLVSNWTWSSADKLKTCFSGQDNGFTKLFFESSQGTDIGKLRNQWAIHLNALSSTFDEFCRSLRFKLGFDCWDEMTERVAERMVHLHLKSDINALLICSGIVRDRIKKGQQSLTRDQLVELLEEHDLFLPPEAEPSVHVYLTTIKEQRFDIDPEYIIDWREHFVGTPNKKGHNLNNPTDWNSVLLPDLEDREAQINKENSCRLIRARGQARLSAWFAFGFTFSEVNRYIIEVDQQGELWRTDAMPNPDFSLVSSQEALGELRDGERRTVAAGISISGDLTNDVRDDLASRQEQVASVLFLQPNRPLGRDSLRGAGDAAGLASEVKYHLIGFVKQWKATRLLLYYYGPLAGACFIGHRMNAVCQTIQIMENQQPGYDPSFVL